MCFCLEVFFVFKQKTAYEMRISDWSSDVCSSDLAGQAALVDAAREAIGDAPAVADLFAGVGTFALSVQAGRKVYAAEGARDAIAALTGAANRARTLVATAHSELFRRPRSEVHTSEPQSLMRTSYADFILTKQKLHHL